MRAMIAACFERLRTVLLLFCFFSLLGLYAYVKISKESYPDIKIPMAHVSLKLTGISPKDAERLLIKPMERQLQNIDGLKEIRSVSFEGGGTIILEFQAGLDVDMMIEKVRNEVDMAKGDLPDDVKEPKVKEINLSAFPVLAVQLSGSLPKRALYAIAEDLKDKIEALKPVLGAPIAGKQDQVVDILVNPVSLETYGFYFPMVLNAFVQNNKMVPAGEIDNGVGRYSVKAPGLVEDVKDILSFPVVSNQNAVVTLSQIADVRATFKDPQGFARARGKDAVVILVSKRTGQNIIETIEAVRTVVDENTKNMKNQLHITYAQDGSGRIKDMLSELQNSIILAVILVMMVIVLTLGKRSAFLVGIAVPGSFLMGVFALHFLGYTMNMVVLFSLILSVGMLVDGAIIVVEYADRKMLEGLLPRDAYLDAAVRMAWPVITSTLTILVVFLPLLFWPGIVGQFMKFLPITLLATLTASLLMALIFIPAWGSIFGKTEKKHAQNIQSIIASESGPLSEIKGLTGKYIQFLDKILDNPGRIIKLAFGLLGGIFILYQIFGKGVEFFPDVEPEKASYLIHARGNLSIREKDKIVEEVESRLLNIKEFKTIYTEVGKKDDMPEDVVGVITVEFIDWKERPHAQEILNGGLEKTRDIPGIIVEVLKEKKGPSKGKPIVLEVRGTDRDLLQKYTKLIAAHFKEDREMIDIETSLPLNNIEWEVKIDRAEAAKYNITVADIGNVLQLTTSGVKVSTFRPDTSRDEVEIRVRFVEDYRSLAELMRLKIPTTRGNIPVGNFVKIEPKRQISTIDRVNGRRYVKVAANLQQGVLIDKKVKEIEAWLKTEKISADVDIVFKGEEEDKKETGAFLLKAFFVAIFLIVLILVTQFNSFYDVMIVMSAVFFSTFGVFVGLILTQQPYGIVMSGLGVIALSGIIVSNNIIFLDTFKVLRREGMTYEEVREVILRTGAQRVRPVILTKLTTILGLLPILFRMSIDFLAFDISFGAPSSAWWVQLSTAITFGVLFASVLTLVLTPCFLMIRENKRFHKQKTSSLAQSKLRPKKSSKSRKA